MKVITIGWDIAKNVIPGSRDRRDRKRSSFESNSGAARWWRSSKRCRLSLSTWRSARRPIIGHLNSRSLATRYDRSKSGSLCCSARMRRANGWRTFPGSALWAGPPSPSLSINRRHPNSSLAPTELTKKYGSQLIEYSETIREGSIGAQHERSIRQTGMQLDTVRISNYHSDDGGPRSAPVVGLRM